jgi:hypothetical protein
MILEIWPMPQSDSMFPLDVVDPVSPSDAGMSTCVNGRMFETAKGRSFRDTVVRAREQEIPPEIIRKGDFLAPAGNALSLMGQEAVRLRRWPEHLYIPSGADWNNYWFCPPPPNHRYSQCWGTAKYSHVQEEFAMCQAYFGEDSTVQQSRIRREAGVGFLFRPADRLATYTIVPNVSIYSNLQRPMKPDSGWMQGPTSFFWTGVYTVAWEVVEKDGSLRLVRPFNVATILRHTQNEQEHMATVHIQKQWDGGPATAHMMLEGGRTYIVGVVAAAIQDLGQNNNKFSGYNGGIDVSVNSISIFISKSYPFFEKPPFWEI